MRLKFVKPDKYLTRRLVAGDEIELPDTKAGRLHARVYLSKRTAKEMRQPVVVPPPPPAVKAKIEAAVAPIPVAPPATVGAMTTDGLALPPHLRRERVSAGDRIESARPKDNKGAD